jgi:hypothetical protein
MCYFEYAVQKSVAVFRKVGGEGCVCVEVSLRTACCCQKENSLPGCKDVGLSGRHGQKGLLSKFNLVDVHFEHGLATLTVK